MRDALKEVQEMAWKLLVTSGPATTDFALMSPRRRPGPRQVDFNLAWFPACAGMTKKQQSGNSYCWFPSACGRPAG
jgi:hypothetical protein